MAEMRAPGGGGGGGRLMFFNPILLGKSFRVVHAAYVLLG